MLGSLKIKYNVTDLERALINALRRSLPEAECHGCLFHLSQAAWKRIGYLGEVKFYKENVLYKKAIKMMLCLALVPTQDVLAFYDDIKEFIIKNNLQIVDNFNSYFEKNYLGISESNDAQVSDTIYHIDF
jgi:hypothetical protein